MVSICAMVARDICLLGDDCQPQLMFFTVGFSFLDFDFDVNISRYSSSVTRNRKNRYFILTNVFSCLSWSAGACLSYLTLRISIIFLCGHFDFSRGKLSLLTPKPLFLYVNAR